MLFCPIFARLSYKNITRIFALPCYLLSYMPYLSCTVRPWQIRIRTEIALGGNNLDLNALMPKCQGTQKAWVQNYHVLKRLTHIWSSQKRHVTATSQDIFTFLPRLVHSYRDEPISRRDYPGKTT